MSSETHVPVQTGENGTIITTPQTGAPLSATAMASQAAREALAAHGTAIPPEGTPAPVTPPAPPPTREPGQPGQPAQVRASDGTFAPPLPENVPANQPPEAGREGENEEQPPGEGAPTPEEIAARERTVSITLDDGAEVDLDVGDAALAATVRSSIEQAREAEAIRADAEARMAEIAQIRDQVEIDPVGFTLSRLAKSPAGQDHLALSLLTQPEVWERLKPTIEQMVGDPNALRTITAEQRAARAEYRERAQSEMAENRAVSENIRDIQTVCAAMLDPQWSKEQQQVAYADMLRDLQQYADQADVQTIPPDHIPVILARRLTALGLDPVQTAARAAKARTGSTSKTPSRATAQPAAVPRVPAAPRPAPTGTQFVAAQTRRQAVAIPASGAGSPHVGSDLAPPTKPDGSKMGVTETLAWHRQQLGKGKRTLTR